MEDSILKLSMKLEKLSLQVENLTFLTSNLLIMQNLQYEILTNIASKTATKAQKAKWKNEGERVAKLIESVIEHKQVNLNSQEKTLLEELQVKEAIDKWKEDIMFTCGHKQQFEGSSDLSCTLTKKECRYELCPLQRKK